MSSRYEIPKSYLPIKIQTVIIGLVALLLFLTTNRIIHLIDEVIPAETTTISFILRSVALIVAILSVVATWVRSTRSHYFLEDGSLIIKSSGLLKHGSQQIITPHHTSQLVLTRSFFGSRFGYGDIIIETDSPSQKRTHTLKNIVNPEKIIAELHSRL